MLIRLENSYDGYEVELGTTNGAERISLSVRRLDEYKGIAGSMSPDDAEKLGVDLIQRAGQVRRRQAELAEQDASES